VRLYTGAVISQAANVLTSAQFSIDYTDGYLDGGYILRNGLEFRMIATNVGTDITLLLPFEDFDVTDNFQIYPGCDRSSAECNTKFSNLDNYGGFEYIPIINPFESGLDN